MSILLKEQQIQGWSSLYNKPISEKELAEISDNLNGFFTVLKKWNDETNEINEEINDRRIYSNS